MLVLNSITFFKGIEEYHERDTGVKSWEII